MKMFLCGLIMLISIGLVNIAEAAQFTITIPDGAVSKIVDAFAGWFNYQEEVDNPEGEGTIPNPITKAQFAKQHIRRFIRDVYIQYKNRDFEADWRTQIETINQETEDITVE